MPLARWSIALLLLAAALLPACSREYPARPLRLIVPFPAGGTSDIIGRLMAEHGGKVLGQQIVVENRAGAGGNVGTETAARATPDGYTLVLCTIGTCAINAAVYRELSYDAQRDFAPLILVGSIANVLAVHPGVPVRDVTELVALAKAKPGTLSFASSGFGSSPHLSGELFNSMAGTDVLHVPYKGSAPAIVDLRGGQVQMFFDNTPSILPHIRSGDLRALATTGAQRSQALPDVPTMQEQGFAGFVITPWFALLAPAATPANIVERLNQVFNRALRDPALLERLRGIDMIAAGGSPAELAAHMRAEADKWARLVKEKNIRVE